jgi:hypothetical protein
MNKEILSEINRFREIIGLNQINEAVTGTSPIYEALEKFWERFGVRGVEKSEIEALEKALSTDAKLVRDFDEIGTKLSNPSTIQEGERLLNSYLTNLSGFQRLITILDRAAPQELNKVIDKTFKSRMGLQYDNFVQAYQLDGNNGMKNLYDALTPQANRSQRLEYLMDKWKPETPQKGVGGGGSGKGTGSGSGTSGGGTGIGGGIGGGLGGRLTAENINTAISEISKEFPELFKTNILGKYKFSNELARVTNKIRREFVGKSITDIEKIIEQRFEELQEKVRAGVIKESETISFLEKWGPLRRQINPMTGEKQLNVAATTGSILAYGAALTVLYNIWSYGFSGGIRKTTSGEIEGFKDAGKQETTPTQDNTTPQDNRPKQGGKLN